MYDHVWGRGCGVCVMGCIIISCMHTVHKQLFMSYAMWLSHVLMDSTQVQNLHNIHRYHIVVIKSHLYPFTQRKL